MQNGCHSGMDEQIELTTTINSRLKMGNVIHWSLDQIVQKFACLAKLHRMIVECSFRAECLME